MPDYYRHEVTPGIVHLGVGQFSRSHFNLYTDSILNKDPTWGIVGAGIMESDGHMNDVLQNQDFMYTCVTKGSDDKISARICGSMVDYIWAGQGPENRLRLVEQMSDPAIKLVSLTITEKGYTADLTRMVLDHDLPQNNWMKTHSAGNTHKIDALTQGIAPHMSALSFLTAAIENRRRAELTPFTVMSCDNLQSNGTLTKNLLIDYAALFDESLATYIDENIQFPNSMVDRITPKTVQADIDDLHENWGIIDGWPVTAEDFTQFVIEDKFVDGRPPWEAAGALIVNDVLPYEKMKLRLLNGGHQCLAYLSAVAGFEKVDEATRDPIIN